MSSVAYRNDVWIYKSWVTNYWQFLEFNGF